MAGREASSDTYLSPIMAGGGLIIIVIVFLINWAVEQERVAAHRTAEITTTNITKVLADNINSVIEKNDLGIRSVLDEIYRQQKAGRWDDDALRDGANGKLRFAVTNVANPQSDLSQREDFIALRDDPQIGLVVSPPVLGATTQQWAIALARRIDNPDGSFGGAVYAPMSIKALTQSFGALHLGPGGTIALYHASYVMAARFPDVPGPKSPIGTTTISDQLRAIITSGAETSQYDYVSTVDGVHRTANVRRIEGRPYIVLAGLAEDDYLADWRHDRDRLLLFGAFTVALVVLGLVLVYHNISGRQQTVTALKKANDELTAARNKADAANQAKSDFLAMMSHEIRTPITGVLGMADLLRHTPLNQEQSGYLDALATSTKTLLTILNDILDFSKIEAGKIKLEKTTFSVQEAVQSTVAMFMPSATSKGLALAAHCSGDLPAEVLGDPARFKQILFNLTSNAIKFTEHGTISILVSVTSRTDDAVTLLVAVEDTGIGIPPEHLPFLFKTFSQLDASTSRRYGGTGLGLAITRRLIEMMGGSIGAERVSGGGTRFCFTLPLGAASAHREPAPEDRPPAPSAAGQPLRVLVAEDNPINQMLVKAILQKMGHTVEVAGNGRIALEAVTAREFDVVLMDMQMPEMDGETATRAIRALPAPRNRLPIIALTANAMKEHRDRYMAAGVDDVLSKPIEWDALRAALDAPRTRS